MQRLELGGGGSRDTLQAALGSEYAPLTNAFAAARQGQEQGFGSMFGSQLQREKIAGTLAAELEGADYAAGLERETLDYKDQLSDEDEQAKLAQQTQDEEDAVAGEEQAILDHYTNVMQSYAPDSPEYQQAVRALQTFERSKGGSAKKRAGYIKGITRNNFMDPFAQGTLGMEGYRPATPQPDARDQKPVRQVPKGFEGIDNDLND
jgi:hypothetical protein